MSVEMNDEVKTEISIIKTCLNGLEVFENTEEREQTMKIINNSVHKLNLLLNPKREIIKCKFGKKCKKSTCKYFHDDSPGLQMCNQSINCKIIDCKYIHPHNIIEYYNDGC